MDLRFRNWTYIQTSFWLNNHDTTSSSQARCVCGIFVDLIFINSPYNATMTKWKKLSLSNKCPTERLHIDKKSYLICSLLLRQLINIYFTMYLCEFDFHQLSLQEWPNENTFLSNKCPNEKLLIEKKSYLTYPLLLWQLINIWFTKNTWRCYVMIFEPETCFM